MLACYEEILKDARASLCIQNSVPYFFKLSSDAHTSPPVLLDIGDDDSDDVPIVYEEVPRH
jgi:hypothetical protein